jgi:hypothetical protein
MYLNPYTSAGFEPTIRGHMNKPALKIQQFKLHCKTCRSRTEPPKKLNYGFLQGTFKTKIAATIAKDAKVLSTELQH